MRLSALLLVAISTFAAEIPHKAPTSCCAWKNSITTRTAKDGDYSLPADRQPDQCRRQHHLARRQLRSGSCDEREAQRTRQGPRRAGDSPRDHHAYHRLGLQVFAQARFRGLRRGRPESRRQRKLRPGRIDPRSGRRAHRHSRRQRRVHRSHRRSQSARGAGIGAGAGAAVGLATVLLTRGREVELRQGKPR